MAFDGSTTFSATTATLVAGVFTDTFSLSSVDVDMVRIDLVAGQKYQIDIDNGTAGDFHLRIFDAFGSEVRANDDGVRSNDDVVFSLSPWIEFAPNYSGTYSVAISPYYLQGYDPTSLAGRTAPENPIATTAGTLTITEQGTNFWPSAGSINAITAEDSSDETDLFREEDGNLRVSYVGAVDTPTDVDIARIDLAKGDVVVIDVNGLEGNGTVLRVFDDNGVQIGIDGDSGFGTDPELSFAAPVFDDYYIAITGDGNATYNALDGTGTVAGVTGDFEVIVHRNPTQIGSSSANSIFGSSANNYIVSLAGSDTISGNDGNDTLAGGDDNDSVFGGNGNDVLYGEHGNDTVLGDAGNDVLSGGIGDDTLDGGTGTDLLEGGSGNDTLNGGAGSFADTISGGLGDDSLVGLSGNDVLNGEAGNDSLRGDAQNDLLFGGAGFDTLRGGSGNDSVDGGGDADQVFGDIGDDSLIGGTGGDTLNGGLGSDSVLGDTGTDSLIGGGGNDALFGGIDNDVLEGGGDQDRLSGGAGIDTLRGGGGADVFVFLPAESGTDRVEDMILLQDLIDLSAIFDATGAVVTAGNLSEFVQCTAAGAGADSFLGIDADGLTGGTSFTTIALVIGVTPLALFDANNFIL